MATEQNLSRGQRVRLDALGIGQNAFLIDLSLVANATVIDVACLGLDANRKLADERYMVFFNQPESPCGGCKQVSPGRFLFDLTRLPSTIDALVLTLAIDGSGLMKAIGNCEARICSPTGAPLARFPFNGQLFVDEKAVILLEIYRKDGQWRLSLVAQGFNGGLDALVTHFGGTVAANAQPAPPPAPPPAPAKKVSLSKITLTKPDQKHRISLVKDGSAPSKITVKATWSEGPDGSDDLDLRVGLLLPNGQMTFIQAPDRAGAFDSPPYVRHLGDVTSASIGMPSTETVEVNPRIATKMNGQIALVFSVYSALSNGAVSVATMNPKMIMEYGDQVVECAYNFQSSQAAGNPNIYSYVIGVIEIDGDSISLSPSGRTSTPDSECTPWLIRNGNSVNLSMDGPAVFKGEHAGKEESINRHNPHRYI